MGFGISGRILRRLRDIEAVVLDVDGVLTNGLLWYSSAAEEWKGFHIRDGHGIVLMSRLGIKLGVISGRDSEGVRRRCGELGIRDLLLGVRDKESCFLDLSGRWGVPPERIAFLGDDVVDLSAMGRAGLSVTVPEASFALRSAADWVTRASGGGGAVREFSDWLCFAKTGDTTFHFRMFPRRPE